MDGAVIFDFDGVVIDSLEVQRKAFNDSFRMVSDGPPPSFEEFLSHSGDSIKNIFMKMGLPLSMVEPYREIASSNIHLIQVVEGMVDVFKEIKRLGLKSGICTGKDRKRTIQILNFLNLSDYFDAVVCSDDVSNPKPHPESLLAIIKNLNSTADKSVLIGDGRNDIICAREAGVKSIAVSWGHSPEEILLQESPDFFVYSVDELKQCIKSIFCSLHKESVFYER